MSLLKAREAWFNGLKLIRSANVTEAHVLNDIAANAAVCGSSAGIDRNLIVGVIINSLPLKGIFAQRLRRTLLEILNFDPPPTTPQKSA